MSLESERASDRATVVVGDYVMLHRLPVDLLLMIIDHLSPSSTLALRQSSRGLYFSLSVDELARLYAQVRSNPEEMFATQCLSEQDHGRNAEKLICSLCRTYHDPSWFETRAQLARPWVRRCRTAWLCPHLSMSLTHYRANLGKLRARTLVNNDTPFGLRQPVRTGEDYHRCHFVGHDPFVFVMFWDNRAHECHGPGWHMAYWWLTSLTYFNIHDDQVDSEWVERVKDDAPLRKRFCTHLKVADALARMVATKPLIHSAGLHTCIRCHYCETFVYGWVAAGFINVFAQRCFGEGLSPLDRRWLAHVSP
ncbi:MAG: hypothetical protein M1838_001970 [Thelocarpon superellum]|nr:MAG: hypothetical protein M1838_001970 [Thelocarpon superellum]